MPERAHSRSAAARPGPDRCGSLPVCHDGQDAHRAEPHRRSPRRDGLRGALQLRPRPQARRPVHPPHRGHRPRAQLRGERGHDLRRPALARPSLGRGSRRRRAVRAVPAERADRGLPEARPRPRRARRRLPVLLHAREARRVARGAEGEEAQLRLRRPLPRPAPRRGRAPARGRRERRRPARDARRGRDGRAGPAPRRGPLRERAGRRPGAAQERRLPDVPPRERGGRPPHGDHPRDPRRGVALVAAEARGALPRLRLGRSRLLPPAAPAQRRPLEDLEAQEPGEPQLLPPRRLPAGGDAQLPRAHGLGHARRARGVLGRRVRRASSRSSASRSAGRCSTSRSSGG